VRELLVLAAGLPALLLINGLLLRRAFAPLRGLEAFMRTVDPLRPGARADMEPGDPELDELVSSFNDMIDRLERERRDSARRALAAQERERLRIEVSAQAPGDLSDEEELVVYRVAQEALTIVSNSRAMRSVAASSNPEMGRRSARPWGQFPMGFAWPVHQPQDVVRVLVAVQRPHHVSFSEMETWLVAQLRTLDGAEPMRLIRVSAGPESWGAGYAWVIELRCTDRDQAGDRLREREWSGLLGDLRLLGMRPAVTVLADADAIEIGP
jgi:hypothetical protein